MDSRYLQKDTETQVDYVLRLATIKLEEKPDDLEWQEIVDLVGLNCHYDSLRKAMQPDVYGAVAVFKYFTDKYENRFTTDEDILENYATQKREIYKERQKLRDEKSEYRGLLREQARMELFFERIDEAADKIAKKKDRGLPEPIFSDGDSDKLFSAFGDCHYGSEFLIEGFNGKVINEYNPKIFEQRMVEYRNELIEFGQKNNINHLYLVDLGDSIEGKLHISSLQSVRGNIVDDIMDYADYIETWLYDLSQDFHIEFYTSEGNHADLRLLTGKKGDFPHENLERIYTRTLKKAFSDNPNVNIHDGLNGINYFDVNGYKFLTAHGNNEKNIKNSIKEYEDTYDIDINYLCVGHLHTKNEIEVARGKEAIYVRSIMGTNTYAKDLKKTSEAGATIFTVRKDYGKKYVNEVKFY